MIDFSLHPMLDALHCLSPSEQEQIVVRAYPAGSFLIQEYQISEQSLYLLLNGICVADKLSPWEENFFSTYKVLPGEFIGLYEILSPKPIKRSISIRAKTPVTALCIGGEQLLNWQTQYPALYNWIITEVLSSRYQKHSLLVNAIRLSTSIGGAYYLHKLYQQYRDACYPAGFLGPVKIWDTHEEIANALACDIRSVDRNVREYLRGGFISCEKKKIHIDAQQNDMLVAYIRSHA